MRRLVVTAIALSLAAALAGCGKSSTQSQGAQATSEAPTPALTPDEIKKVQAAVYVFFGDRDHEAKVSFDQIFLGAFGFLLTVTDDRDGVFELFE